MPYDPPDVHKKQGEEVYEKCHVSCHAVASAHTPALMYKPRVLCFRLSHMTAVRDIISEHMHVVLFLMHVAFQTHRSWFLKKVHQEMQDYPSHQVSARLLFTCVTHTVCY